MTTKLRIAIVQEWFPHYRIPVYKKLASHPCLDLTLIHGASSNKAGGKTVLSNVDTDMPFSVVKGPILEFHLFVKKLLWHRPLNTLLKTESFDVIIHQFEMKFASLWPTLSMQRAQGRKFILWGIGHSLRPTPLLDRMRRLIARKADAVVFYGDETRQLYIKMGLDPSKLFVARNSVDLTPIKFASSQWSRERLNGYRREKNLQGTHVLLTVGTLVERKRVDLLLQAVSMLRKKHPNIKMIVIGDGPLKTSLHEMTLLLGINENVKFLGEITEQEQIAPWFLLSDLVVAPGQVGLLATQTHAYGRPLVTCDNPAIQGPEREIFIPGKTGAVFQHNNAAALANVIDDLLENKEKRVTMGEAARNRAYKEFGISNMVNGFLLAISYVTDMPLPLFNTNGTDIDPISA